MNKKEIIDEIAQAADLTKHQARKALEGFLVAVTDELSQGEIIKLSGFGNFIPKQQAATVRRKFRTGERMEIPARRVVKFRPSQTLSNIINF